MPKIEWAQNIDECQDPADYAYCTCKVYSCGYSQPKRDHLSIERLKAGTAETDCSAGVSWWLYMGKYLNECPWFHTAIEREYLQEHGFDLIDANAGFVKMQRNDVLWRPGHTALYIGEGMQAEALRTERHDAGYDGSTPGDQDDGETVVRPLTYDWDYVIRKKSAQPGKHLVLDIYHGNRGIDLKAWKDRHNVWAVIPKCGGSEDDRLNRFEETTFHEQVAQAKEAGLHVGAFYYSDALSCQDALADANHCIDKCLAGVELDMPVYIDIEEPAQLSLPEAKLTAIVITFCEHIRQAGYMPGIYSGYDGFSKMTPHLIEEYALWAAAWRTSWPSWAKDYGMWQQGSIRFSDGDIKYADVSGYVDCNWCQVDYPKIINGGDDMQANPIGILYHAEGDSKNLFWNWSPECVPFHVNGAQSKAIQNLTGLKLQKISKADADAIMEMCKARKAWREEGIKS